MTLRTVLLISLCLPQCGQGAIFIYLLGYFYYLTIKEHTSDTTNAYADDAWNNRHKSRGKTANYFKIKAITAVTSSLLFTMMP